VIPGVLTKKKCVNFERVVLKGTEKEQRKLPFRILISIYLDEIE
jgi:hypothetical protein